MRVTSTANANIESANGKNPIGYGPGAAEEFRDPSAAPGASALKHWAEMGVDRHCNFQGSITYVITSLQRERRISAPFRAMEFCTRLNSCDGWRTESKTG